MTFLQQKRELYNMNLIIWLFWQSSFCILCLKYFMLIVVPLQELSSSARLYTQYPFTRATWLSAKNALHDSACLSLSNETNGDTENFFHPPFCIIKLAWFLVFVVVLFLVNQFLVVGAPVDRVNPLVSISADLFVKYLSFVNTQATRQKGVASNAL